MTPAERRTALVRLLASIDQQIREAESLTSDPMLWHEERAFAEAKLAIHLDAVKRVEAMLERLAFRRIP